MSNAAIIAACLYCLVREAFFIWQVRELTNKIMSKNYFDYVQSKNLGKEMPAQPQQFMAPTGEELEFDQQRMGVLTGIMG